MTWEHNPNRCRFKLWNPWPFYILVHYHTERPKLRDITLGIFMPKWWTKPYGPYIKRLGYLSFTPMKQDIRLCHHTSLPGTCANGTCFDLDSKRGVVPK